MVVRDISRFWDTFLACETASSICRHFYNWDTSIDNTLPPHSLATNDYSFVFYVTFSGTTITILSLSPVLFRPILLLYYAVLFSCKPGFLLFSIGLSGFYWTYCAVLKDLSKLNKASQASPVSLKKSGEYPAQWPAQVSFALLNVQGKRTNRTGPLE